ncbi:MAG TPA: RraA family protein [Casimicrobiaceae bacterium]|jgi:4-hydroxy-4-methyl-2-oxoglutarate aldolase|nr:RraA family protein [Casimicrobiaceae bacterium]
MANAAALTVRRNFARPSPELVARLAGAPTGWVVDANGRTGALDYRIRPLTRTVKFCGVALTVHSRGRDNLAPYAAIEYARTGDVIVVATDDYQEASVAGDVMIGMMKTQGVAAFVTDGLVRDIDGLNAVGIPVCARGLSPNSPHKDGPGTIGLPITLGGVVVTPGDVVIGDQDGIVVVAREALEGVLASLVDVAEKEKKLDRMVASGAVLPPGLAEIIAQKGVRHLD